MEHKDCLLCGVGGQGTILASKLLADAALLKGATVRATETIGMSQRGGSVVSHLRMGEESASPMIPHGRADIMIAFEPAEGVRSLPYLSKDGVLIVAKKAVKPVTATLTNGTYDGTDMLDFLYQQVKHLVVVDGDAICSQLGSSKVLNVVLLGAATASGMLGFTIEDMAQAIQQRVPEKFQALNQNALIAGANIVVGGTSPCK